MLGRDAKVERLRTVPLLAPCSRRELASVARITDEVDIRVGREVTREGAFGREFFIILEGTAEARQGGKLLRTLGPGDFFGEIALVWRVPRTATVRALTPLRALVLVDRDFRALLESQPKVQDKVLQALAERLAPTSI
jgi:CRP-like cAMP-binding protein